MKNKIEKIFNKKNNKIIIPVLVLLVLSIVVFIYIKEYRYNNYRNKSDHLFYEYLGEEKVEYTATVSLNKKKVIKAFVPKVYTINYDTIPIYYKDESKVIFPSEMSIIFPLKQKLEYKIPEFSYIEKINNLQYLTFDKYHNNLDHYVVYDGKDLYFFSDSVTFTINNEEITLSPFSYVISTIDELKYYDYETDTYKQIDTKEKITVENKYYKLNVTDDDLEYFGERIILTNNIDFLGFLK